jgi:uncharacterized protein (DUF2252 family)
VQNARRLLLATIALAFACNSQGSTDERENEVIAALADGYIAAIRTRPALAAGQFNRMAGDGVDYYRGTLPLYMHDWTDGGSVAIGASQFALEAPLVLSEGDTHPENFGTLRASDGSYAFEPNDFDAGDRAPYLWDVRRLCAGMALAAHLANSDDANAQATSAAASHSIAHAVAEGYASAMASLASGGEPVRISPPTGNAALDDLFTRSMRDAANRAELTDDTIKDPTTNTRRLLRGALDPTDPENTYGDVPPSDYADLPDAIERYRQTLINPPPADYFTLLDAAREFGSGVSSWSKIRVILLVRGPTDDPSDDVILELKELVDSGIAGLYPPGLYYDDVETRVRTASRAAWARPDAEPLWGTSSWEGFHIQIKNETEAFKTLRVAKLVGSLGTVDVLTDLAQRMGGLIARVHSAPFADSPNPAAVINARIAADTDAFEDEQADAGDAYATEVLADFLRFQNGLITRGPSLGVPIDPSDLPPPDLQALYGTPPPVQPFVPSAPQ